MIDIASTAERQITEEADFLQIKSVDHLRFWVGNAKQCMYYWWKGFGFTPVAYLGLETGNRRSASYVLESGKIRFIVTAAYSPTDEISAHQMLHADGVKHVALGVEDVKQAYRATTDRGAVGVWELRETHDDDGTFRTSAIRTYGEVIHVFLSIEPTTKAPSRPATSRLTYRPNRLAWPSSIMWWGTYSSEKWITGSTSITAPWDFANCSILTIRI